MVVVDGYQYDLLKDYREGFKEEEFFSRYSEVLARYDYIVGDWGYGQLRLKGFFNDKNQKATFDTKISTFEDYLYEFCNFGCAHFILQKVGKVEVPKIQEVKEEAPPSVPTEAAVEEVQ